MGVRFTRSIKIGNLLKINLSKSGVSATIGKKGASINLGKKGTYLNLSPAVAGITGTGLSYRQKITGGYESALGKLTGSGKKEKEDIKENKELLVDSSVIDEYNKSLEANINIHKYTDNVLSKKDFDAKLDSLESDASKEVYKLLIDGDEDTIESYVGAFLNNLDLNYEVSANYELEDHILYVDLDLPEIETFNKEYPCEVKNEVVTKTKTNSMLKEEYGKSVLSLAVYIAANFFNVSSYVEEIVLSGFTTRRNNDGDLKDEYLYSVKFLRNEFEQTDLSKLDDTYSFLLKFENRINTTSYSFKSIKPYEMASTTKTNSLIDDAIAGLKELGYKQADINKVLDKLNEEKLQSSGEYIKLALKLLASK